MNTKTIAIAKNSQPNLAEAIAQRVKMAYGSDTTVIIVDRVSDRPAGAELASLGMPNYIGGSQEVIVHNFGTKMLPRNATPEQQNALWATVRPDENGHEKSVEEILAVLSDPSVFTITPAAAKLVKEKAVLEAKVQIAEAESPEAKIEGYKALVASLL